MKAILGLSLVGFTVGFLQWKFEETVSIGNLITLAGVLAAMSGGWAAMRSDLRIVKKWIEHHQELSEKARAEMAELKAISSQLTAMMVGFNRRLELLEHQHEIDRMK